MANPNRPAEGPALAATGAGDGTVGVVVNGRALRARSGASVLQAWLESGEAAPAGANVGCGGQGVCGACRALIRRPGPEPTEMGPALACEVLPSEGMEVIFLDLFPARPHHGVEPRPVQDGEAMAAEVQARFPEASACRHCSGCDRACPKGLAPEAAVQDAVAGLLGPSAAAFDECVMCGLCTAACPELIDPNHLGVFVRRLLAMSQARPVDLLARLAEIRSGSMVIDQAALLEESAGNGARR